MTIPTSTHADDADLTSLGYEPSLHRKLGRYASFAAGFSFVSILTTIFQLFAFGYSFAGPAFFWTWPIVLVGQLLVALNFAELAARYPLSGAVYQWSRRVGGETVGWFAGWFMAVAQVVTAAAAAIALQVVLPQLWSGFQLVGGDPALNTVTGAANAVVLGAVLLVATTVINVLGVRLMSHVNSIGVTCEIIGVIAVVLALITAAQRGPDVVMDTTVLQNSDLGFVGAFLVSGLMHELLFYHVTRASPSWEVTLFFVLQGACLVVELAVKRWFGGRWQLHWAISWPLTVGFVVMTAMWLFFPPLIRSGADERAIEECKMFLNLVKGEGLKWIGKLI